jgi:acetyl-CoA carboxylase biotin carboxyl carrier protein
MTDHDHALDAIERAAADLLPQLTERLGRHGLGEIEVVQGDLRIRVRAGAAPSGGEAPFDAPAGSAGAVERPDSPSLGAGVDDAPPPSVAVTSPAVGFFVYGDGLGPGQDVGKGDSLGHVEVLGVRHEVRSPRGGTVRNLVAESGEAVEYGQTVVEIQAGETAR